MEYWPGGTLPTVSWVRWRHLGTGALPRPRSGVFGRSVPSRLGHLERGRTRLAPRRLPPSPPKSKTRPLSTSATASTPASLNSTSNHSSSPNWSGAASTAGIRQSSASMATAVIRTTSRTRTRPPPLSRALGSSSTYGRATPGEQHVFGDMTWVAFAGPRVPVAHAEVFAAVREARDQVLERLDAAWCAGDVLQGWQLDQVARQVLTTHRLGRAIRPPHRAQPRPGAEHPRTRRKPRRLGDPRRAIDPTRHGLFRRAGRVPCRSSACGSKSMCTWIQRLDRKLQPPSKTKSSSCFEPRNRPRQRWARLLRHRRHCRPPRPLGLSPLALSPTH